PRLAARRAGGGARDARPGRRGLRARRPGPGLPAGGAGRQGLPPAGRAADGRGRDAAVAGRRGRQGILARLPQLLRHQPLQPFPDVLACRAPAGAGDRRQRSAVMVVRAALPRALPLLAAAAALALAGCASGPEKSASEASALPDGQAVGSSELPGGRRSPYAPAREDPSKRGNYTAGGLYAPHIKDTVPDELPDVDAIPEPEVVAEPRSRYGNRSPYKVLGKSYRVLDSAEGYDETGLASYYGNKFHGRRPSNLEVYDMYAFTAAHKSLPLPSFARVTNLDNGKSVVVRVNDRGPFHEGRIIDLSYAAAVKIGIRDRGTGRVEVVGLGPGENARNDYDAVAGREPVPAPAATAGNGALQLPPGVRMATGKPQPAPAAGATTAAPSAMDRLVEGGLGGGVTPAAPPSAGVPANAVAAASPVAATASITAHAGETDWRFDMRQDGKAMTADEFDAWMRARRARVATG